MGKVIVIEFVSLDGIVTDPDGSAGTVGGGWAFRHGPRAVAGDKFELGDTLDTGTMLLGRRTWELFAGIWPTRSDDFAVRMNAVPKLVATRTHPDLSAWENSAPIGGELVETVRTERSERDVILAGSISVARELQRHNLVDEYRLLTFPSVIGVGERLFSEALASGLECVSAVLVGAAVLTRYSVRS